MRKATLFAIGFALLFVANAARAELMKMEFIGTTDAESPNLDYAGNVYDYQGLIVTAGDRIRATFIYDSDVVAQSLGSPASGFLNYNNSSTNFFISSTLENLTTNSGPVTSHNYYDTNFSVIWLGANIALTVVDDSTFEVITPTSYLSERRYLIAVVDGLRLNSLTDVGHFVTSGYISFANESSLFEADKTTVIRPYRANATLEEVTISTLAAAPPPVAVPEPASLALLGAGLVSMFGAGRAARRKK